MDKITKEAVSKAINKGIENASVAYEQWSGGLWLWKAPEYLLTVYVANSICAMAGKKYLTIENKTKEAMGDAGAKGQGKLHSAIRGNGKVDILMYWSDGTARAVIEIKNQTVNFKKIEKDVKRIKHMLLRKKDASTLEFGAIGFYISRLSENANKAEEQIISNIDDILTNTKKELGERFNVIAKYNKIKQAEEYNSAWVSCVLLITVK